MTFPEALAAFAEKHGLKSAEEFLSYVISHEPNDFVEEIAELSATVMVHLPPLGK